MKKYIFLVFVGCLLLFIVNGQPKIRVVFYNAENLFDIYDDPSTNDNEFLPDAERNWTYDRFYSKLNKLYKVIAAIGDEEPPEIIALAEIENRFVLQQLILKTPLGKYPYEIVHRDSPDRRGIDVAVLYRSDRIKLADEEFIPVTFDNPQKKTRDILQATFILPGNQQIHLFVNHWPSRYGGQKKSEPNRMRAAQTLKDKTDSLLNRNPQAQIIICGDFNDDPENKSFTGGLGALPVSENISSQKLYNLTFTTREKCSCGTLKYRSGWNFFDQFIVSGSLLDGKKPDTPGYFNVFNAEFLQEKDAKYGGTKPFRTYQGPAFKNGFSDHLPVYLEVDLEE